MVRGMPLDRFPLTGVSVRLLLIFPVGETSANRSTACFFSKPIQTVNVEFLEQTVEQRPMGFFHREQHLFPTASNRRCITEESPAPFCGAR